MIEITRKPYATDLTDSQWEAISPLFSGMRNFMWPKRELVNAVLYFLDNGIKWRNLPHDFPPWQTVSSFYYRAIKSGLWDEILQFLVEITRQIEDRNAQPSYAIIDSQSVKTIGASEERGIDGGKKNQGEKAAYCSGRHGKSLGSESTCREHS